MKKIQTGTAIKNLRGEPMIDPVDQSPITVGSVLSVYAASFVTKDPKKSIRARKLAEALFANKEEEFLVEDADLDLLKETMTDPKHTSLVTGVVNETLQEAETVKVEEAKGG